MAATNLWRTLTALTIVSLCGCTVGPDYSRPAVETPPTFKEIDGWRVANPRDVPNEHWWTIYDDPVLDGLVAEVEVSNQNLKAVEAAYRQSAALVGEARSAYWPTVDANASALRANAGTTGNGSRAILSVSSGATWEIDVWGKIRRNVESEVAGAQASAGDLAAARLSAQSLLAQQYFQLRIDDELERLLFETADAYELSLKITVNRYNAGTAARSDVTAAQTQVESTRAQAIAVGVQRAQLEHAIAVLIGKPPSQFSIAKAPLTTDVPVVPPDLPSALLERRPDVAAAERRVASANAQIGVAVAAYYPDITLTASYGFLGSALDNLIRAQNAVWSVGPQLAQTVFDGGLRSSEVEAARAAYDQSVANYRQTVLTSFQQVEDQLAALRILDQQARVQDRAVKAAIETEQLTVNQYKAGTVAYTAVIVAQAQALQNRETALNILGSQLTASVSLIQAIGGGWSAEELPAP